jgi:hypothetical protein
LNLEVLLGGTSGTVEVLILPGKKRKKEEKNYLIILF